MENLNTPPLQNNKLRFNKKIFILLSIGIIIFAYIILTLTNNVQKIGQNEIEPVVNMFIRDVSSNNEIDAYELYSYEAKKDFSLENFKNMPKDVLDAFSDIKNIKATEYNLLDYSGQKFFTYKGIVIYNNNTKKAVQVVLIYENNNWKINSIEFSKKTY